MNLKGVEFINYLYIIVLSLGEWNIFVDLFHVSQPNFPIGTWINVNVFSSIQWFGILFYIYNVFCVGKLWAISAFKFSHQVGLFIYFCTLPLTDERGKEYFKNLRFLIVFLMSFSNMIMIFQSYVIYEYFFSANQDTYYIQLTNLGFEVNTHESYHMLLVILQCKKFK